MKFSIKIFAVIMLVSFFDAGTAFAWDCITAHPMINSLAFEHFVARFQDKQFADKFTNCGIDNQTRFEGYTYKKAVKTNVNIKINTVNIKANLQAWLLRGGHDADVPQLLMGFRHFYDPIYEPHYMTWLTRDFKKGDKADYESEEAYFGKLGYRADDWNINLEYDENRKRVRLLPKIFRPEIDAIVWAFNHNKNEHNWVSGKKAYKAAMENDTESFDEGFSRSQMFGKAFRALGEVMHMMADMTQPAHTRADSHALYEPVELTLAGEMIKEIIGDEHKSPDFRPTSLFEIDENLHPADQMKKVAVFTNANFFSNDTIFDYEKWNFPRNDKRPYPSPQLSKLKHEKGIYYKFFDGVGWVPLAKETGSKFSKVLNDNDKYGRKNPHFNVMPNMTIPQAKVLMPLAIYSCSLLIKEFLPAFKLSLSLKRTGSNEYAASGEMQHLTDNDPDWAEYGPIQYSGAGYIQVNDELRKRVFSKGKLVGTTETLNKGDKVRLAVRAGGLVIYSNFITIK